MSYSMFTRKSQHAACPPPNQRSALPGSQPHVLLRGTSCLGKSIGITTSGSTGTAQSHTSMLYSPAVCSEIKLAGLFRAA